MLLIFIVLCTTLFGRAISCSSSFPNSCSCQQDGDAITITCSGSDYLEEDLEREINNLFVRRQSDPIRKLVIQNTKLSSIPEVVCRLETLEELDLSQNRLESISPVDCFTYLVHLRSLRLDDNRLTHLYEGSFNGLQQLQELAFERNRLEFIHPRLFSNSSNLISLRDLYMTNNRLTSLEPWPLVRAQVRPGFSADLTYNSITKFTNTIDFRYTCASGPVRVKIYLRANPIRHLTDISNGWNITRMIDIFCFFGMTGSDVTMSLKMVPLECDCQDFDFLRNIRNLASSTLFTEPYCISPVSVMGLKVMSVPLDQLVCGIENQCPTNCVCTKQPSTLTIYVNCTNAGLHNLPLVLPPLNRGSKYRYHLILGQNSIKTIKWMDYMEKTRVLDMSKSKVEVIDDHAWTAFQNMEIVLLNDNNIVKLPRLLVSLKFQNLNTRIHLQNNPISCQCPDQWIKSWLVSMGERITNPNSINCKSPVWVEGKSVLLLSDKDFCSSPPYTTTDFIIIIIPSVAGLVIVNVFAVLMCRRFRVKIYKYVKIHPFDRDECKGESMLFDVFLTCSSDDGNLGLYILTLLEREGFKVCYHLRDFVPGYPISDSIVGAIEKSKRVLCLLTNNFISSQYCMEEFRVAHHSDLQNGRQRLVLLMTERPENFEGENLALELRDYWKRYTFVEYYKDSWKNQLMYALPINRMLAEGKHNPEEVEDETNESDIELVYPEQTLS